MDRATKALGQKDQDVMDMKNGISGLVFGYWTDAEIAATAVEMAQESRHNLANTLNAAKLD